MKSKLKARLEPLGPVQVAPRVQSGFAAMVVLRPESELAAVKTVDAVMALNRHGVKMLAAKRAVEAMVENGEARIRVPSVNSDLARDLALAGIAAAKLATDPVDVRAIRERLKMAQSEFADCFGFNVRSVQNWEQGREPDSVANNYLRVIATDPEAAKRAQLEKLG